MLPPKPVPQPAAAAFVATEMVVDEADLEEACMAAGVGSDAVKRGRLEALLQARKKPRFRSPGPGGRANAAVRHPQPGWEGVGAEDGEDF
eukprot:1308263-Pyramimonas_sp.AAC.1